MLHNWKVGSGACLVLSKGFDEAQWGGCAEVAHSPPLVQNALQDLSSHRLTSEGCAGMCIGQGMAELRKHGRCRPLYKSGASHLGSVAAGKLGSKASTEEQHDQLPRLAEPSNCGDRTAGVPARIIFDFKGAGTVLGTTPLRRNYARIHPHSNQMVRGQAAPDERWQYAQEMSDEGTAQAGTPILLWVRACETHSELQEVPLQLLEHVLVKQ